MEENDSSKLIEAMTYVRDVRVSSDRIDGLFDPLKSTIALLKKFNITTSEETVEALEMIPFKWEDTKKATYNKRETLGPLQSIQQDKVRERTEEFRTRLQEFCKTFHEKAPFEFSTESAPAYVRLTQYHLDLEAMEVEGAEIGKQQELFEVAITNWRDLKTCRTELTMLKLMWDHVQVAALTTPHLPCPNRLPLLLPLTLSSPQPSSPVGPRAARGRRLRNVPDDTLAECGHRVHGGCDQEAAKGNQDAPAPRA